MGFTFSHPALILPFRYLPRKIYSLNGLVIGSMIPDIEYFLRLENYSSFSHTFLGVFLFDLPASICVLFAYHLIIRQTLIRNSPVFIKSRLFHLINFDWQIYFKDNWFIVMYSIILGTFTHLFWDGFTSGSGYFVEKGAFFKSKITLFSLSFPFYKLIKYLSSLIGIFILYHYILKLPKNKNAFFLKSNKHYIFLIFSFTIAFLLIQLIAYHRYISFDAFLKKFISSGLLAMLVISFFYWLKPQEDRLIK